MKKILLTLFVVFLSAAMYAAPEFGSFYYIVKHNDNSFVTYYDLLVVPKFSPMKIHMMAGDIIYGAYYANLESDEYYHYIPSASSSTSSSGSVSCTKVDVDDEQVNYDLGVTITETGTYVIDFNESTQTLSWTVPQKVCINGIYYNLIEYSKTAEVTFEGRYTDGNTPYSGYVDIPASVIYSSNTYSVTCIGIGAFQGCSGLTSVKIPNSVTSLCKYAFLGCKSLWSVEISEKVNSIDKGAFLGCLSLDNVTIPYGVKSIGEKAFSQCVSLSTVSIPNSITSIGDNAFSNCWGLKSVDIPTSVESIGKSAFESCSRLSNVTMPNSVSNIGENVFRDCTSLPIYKNGRYADSYLVEVTDKEITSFEFKEGVSYIGNYAFQQCENLTSISIPNTVKTIGLAAFHLCSSMITVKIPSSVKSIGNMAFSRTALTSVVIPNGVNKIGTSAFSYCSNLSVVSIPNSVVSMGDYSFYGCPKLSDVYVDRNMPLSISNRVFDNADQANSTLHVPTGKVNAYKNADCWKNFGDIVEISSTLAIIDGIELTAKPGLYDKIMYTRNFKNTGWQALYVPFEMSYSDWCDDYEVGYIEGFLSYDIDGNGTVDKTEWSGVIITSGTLHPNTPYIIRAKTTGVKSLELNNAMLYDQEINTIECSSTTVKYEFTGQYKTDTYAIDDKPYYLNDGILFPVPQIIPLRWIMRMTGLGYTLYDKPTSMSGRVRLDDGLTFLEYVESNKKEFVGCQIYTLDGRRIDNPNENLVPGLYINNGKKVMIK